MTEAMLIVPPGTNDEPEVVENSFSKINCTRCLYFRLLQKNPTTTGSCHRIPPVPSVVGMQPHPLDPRQQQPVAMSFWPSVGKTDWCGEFTPKKKPEEQQ